LHPFHARTALPGRFKDGTAEFTDGACDRPDGQAGQAGTAMLVQANTLPSPALHRLSRPLRRPRFRRMAVPEHDLTQKKRRIRPGFAKVLALSSVHKSVKTL